jgi:hypothetical protein
LVNNPTINACCARVDHGAPASFAGEVEGEVFGGGGAVARGFFEGDVADVEGALDVFVAFDEVVDGEEFTKRRSSVLLQEYRL